MHQGRSCEGKAHCYLMSSASSLGVVNPLSLSMLLWNILERFSGMGMSEKDVTWESSDTLLLATIARCSARMSGSSITDFTRRSFLRDLGRVLYIDWLRLWVDWLFILGKDGLKIENELVRKTYFSLKFFFRSAGA